MSDAGLGWSDERVELLKRLWGEGLSASQIAGQLGGITRNAVIGKVHRLGLAGRAKAAAPAAQGAAPPVAAPAPAAPVKPKVERGPEPAPAAPAPSAPVTMAPRTFAPFVAPPTPPAHIPEPAEAERVTIMDLREFMCRWPLGDPTSAEFRFCGARAITGLPYCNHHAQIAYQPAAERKRDRDRRVTGMRA
jgi:GcrA cell cycle regulator